MGRLSKSAERGDDTGPCCSADRFVAELLAASRRDSLVVRRVVVDRRDVAYVKGILEASEGMALLLAERGSELAVVCAPACEQALDRLLGDLRAEIPIRLRSGPPHRTGGQGGGS